jgi:hypothetical protein
MVGDDSATAAFKEFWDREAVLRGAKLVYNTGRWVPDCFLRGAHQNAAKFC